MNSQQKACGMSHKEQWKQMTYLQAFYKNFP
jgi:hypothetical protein